MLPFSESNSQKEKRYLVFTNLDRDIEVRDFKVRVKPSLNWNQAIDEGAPATSPLSKVRMLSSQYVERLGFTKEKYLYLIRFKTPMENDQWAREWGRSQNLLPAGAKALLALGALEPRLDLKLHTPNLAVSSLDIKALEGAPKTVYLWWDQADVRAMLGKTMQRCNKHVWFAFQQ